jgi:hypothetical protein
LERRTEVYVPLTIDKKEELRDKWITIISKLNKSIEIRDDEIRKCEIDVRTYKERGRTEESRSAFAKLQKLTKLRKEDEGKRTNLEIQLDLLEKVKDNAEMIKAQEELAKYIKDALPEDSAKNAFKTTELMSEQLARMDELNSTLSKEINTGSQDKEQDERDYEAFLKGPDELHSLLYEKEQPSTNTIISLQERQDLLKTPIHPTNKVDSDDEMETFQKEYAK